jgi:cytochrome P450
MPMCSRSGRQPELFCSGEGATSIPDMPVPFLDFFGSMINMDDPRHTRLRGIVSRAFTPKMLKKVEDDVQRAAARIVDDVRHQGQCDFVTEVAAAVQLQIICDMMGIPASDYPAVLRHRVEHPGDDLTSALVHAEVDGERLTDQELGSFFILLVVAGNETTRNAISHGLKALTDNPDERKLWVEDFEGVAPTAVEEIVRWASPVIWMRRTATRDATLRGERIAAGSKLLLFYNSANRDADVFDDPFGFDVARDPNPHVGFGGPGPHFCLGAHLARREITVMFRELLRRLPDIESSGPPEMLRSSFINGIKHLPCTFTPGGAVA